MADLKHLFQDHIYGQFPTAPKVLSGDVVKSWVSLNGRAYCQSITVIADNQNLNLLFVKPHNTDNKDLTVFLFLNGLGNHTISTDPQIPFAQNASKTGTINNKRGIQKNRIDIEHIINQGYGFVTLHQSDITPDCKHANPNGCVISKWSGGISTSADFLKNQMNIKNVIVTGFSRRGKAALLAAAFNDKTIDGVIAHQSGTGGSAPSVKKSMFAETVKQINTRFPHWFNNTYKSYNNTPEDLPVTQADLLSLIAPRPVLISNGSLDFWSDPKGTLEMVNIANKGRDHITYKKRFGGHGIKAKDWRIFTQFIRQRVL